MVVKSQTWTRESHGLFDYESKNLMILRNFSLEQSALFYRELNEVHTFKGNFQELAAQEQSKVLALIEYSAQGFLLREPSLELKDSSAEENWLVVNSLHSGRGYRLAVGDIIRFGRAQMTVCEIQGLLSEVSGERIISASKLHEGVSERHGERGLALSAMEGSCRICLGGPECEEDPLVHLCKCSGSVGLLHLCCLQKWLRSKVEMKVTDNLRTYTVGESYCELCKSRYPERISVSGASHDLLLLEKPQGKYVVFELKLKANIKDVLVFELGDVSAIRIGRSHDSDIRITDISVSRHHATIKVGRNSLSLEDHNSKFGTLAKLQKPVALQLNSSFSVQTGRSVLSFCLKQGATNWCCLSKKRQDA